MLLATLESRWVDLEGRIRELDKHSLVGGCRSTGNREQSG
jgi:hypothetical protein